MPSESFRSFKTSVTYKKNFFDFMPDKCVNCEAAFVGHISSFLRDIVRYPVLIFRPVYFYLELLDISIYIKDRDF